MYSLLKAAREKRGMSQLEIARVARISVGYLSKLENGLQQASPRVAAVLADIFKGEITESQILYPEKYQERPEPVAKKRA